MNFTVIVVGVAVAVAVGVAVGVGVATELVTRIFWAKRRSTANDAITIMRRQKLRPTIEILEALPQSEAQIRTALANAYSDLGAVLCDRGAAPQAIEYLLKAIRIQEDLPERWGGHSGTNSLNIIRERVAVAQRNLVER